MKINTFLEARELYDKYTLCETVLKYLSDEEIPFGQKYLETLKIFVNTFQSDFMMFVHEKMTACGEAFEALQCCDEQPETPTPPSEPKEPKFPIGSKVEVVGGQFDGRIGTVMDFDPKDGSYYVMSDFDQKGNLFSMWFDEILLTAYTEEEQPETPEEDGGTTAPGEGE